MMKRSSEQNHHNTSRLYIPLDLTIEILKKLPVKSLVRFGCVSKQWSSIIGSNKDFIDSIVARSSTQPQHDHFIFHKWSNSQHFFVSSSSTYPHQNTKEVTHAHAVPISERIQSDYTVFQCVRGLIGFLSSTSHQFVIHNPTTRQSISLPDPGISLIRSYLFGYDPFENLYKVVCLHHNMNQHFHVFTLGDPAKKWRSIKCGIGRSIPLLKGWELYPVYIKGKIYFRMMGKGYMRNVVLISFDVRSENFSHVQAPKPFRGNKNIILINYQGKLGLMEFGYDLVNKIWVMEDDEKKQEWFNHFSYTNDWNFKGVNHGGENIFLNRSLYFRNHSRLCFLYYDPKGKRERYVELKITHPEEIELDNVSVSLAIPDHVENTMYLH